MFTYNKPHSIVPASNQCHCLCVSRLSQCAYTIFCYQASTLDQHSAPMATNVSQLSVTRIDGLLRRQLRADVLL